MDTKNSSIKLGRVSKNVERSISISFPGDVFVYISGKNLDSFAFRYPHDYLRRIEVAKDILLRPHFASYDAKEGMIYLFRTYYKNGIFKTYLIRIKKEKCWEFLSLTTTKEDGSLSKLKIKEIDSDRRKKKN